MVSVFWLFGVLTFRCLTLRCCDPSVFWPLTVAEILLPCQGVVYFYNVTLGTGLLHEVYEGQVTFLVESYYLSNHIWQCKFSTTGSIVTQLLRCQWNHPKPKPQDHIKAWTVCKILGWFCTNCSERKSHFRFHKMGLCITFVASGAAEVIL